jgi:HAD superfamily phosphoserine phosphatase-like hydrolase
MEIKVALLDFDGTLVTKDVLDVLCKSIGKEKESQDLNAAFHRGELVGLEGLIGRINFLKGMTKTQISEILESESFLRKGCIELMNFFKQHSIITILVSGNIVPVLEYYQQLLSIDYIVGSKPQMDGETVMGIDESAFSSKSYKLDGIQAILKDLVVTSENIIALGDSPSDKGMFEFSNYAIAVNPKGNIADSADTVVEEDLNEAVKLLEELI